MTWYRRLALEALDNRELLTSLFATANGDSIQASDSAGNPGTSAAWGYRAYNAIVDEASRSTDDFVVTVTLMDSAEPPTSTLNLGDVIQSAKGDDVITIDLAVIIENVPPGNQDAAVLGSSTVLDFRGPNGTAVWEFGDDTMTAGIQPLDLRCRSTE